MDGRETRGSSRKCLLGAASSGIVVGAGLTFRSTDLYLRTNIPRENSYVSLKYHPVKGDLANMSIAIGSSHETHPALPPDVISGVTKLGTRGGTITESVAAVNFTNSPNRRLQGAAIWGVFL